MTFAPENLDLNRICFLIFFLILTICRAGNIHNYFKQINEIDEENLFVNFFTNYECKFITCICHE